MNDLTPLGIEGKASSRILNFFWVLDVSGSMAGKKIEMLNWAIKEVIPSLEEIEDSERITIMMRVIAFDEEAWWHIGPDAVSLSEFFNHWEDLKAGSYTNTAEAIEMLTEELDISKMGTRNVPPVCILISDGYCTSGDSEYKSAIEKLDSIPWGKKAVRLSIGIKDTNYGYNKDELDMFISPYLKDIENAVETLHADNPKKLLNYIKTASTTASVGASRSNSSPDGKLLDEKPVNIDKGMLEEESIVDNLTIDDAGEVF